MSEMASTIRKLEWGNDHVQLPPTHLSRYLPMTEPKSKPICEEETLPASYPFLRSRGMKLGPGSKV
jgi:hypothetical protein